MMTNFPIFEAETLDGEAVMGTMIRLDSDMLVLSGPEGPVSLATDKLLRLIPQTLPSPKQSAPTVCVYLADNSIIAANEFTTANQRAQVVLSDGQQIDLPARMVLAVRLQKQLPAHGETWSRILAIERPTDLLVTHKADVLDYHRGAIEDVTGKIVQFSVGGNILPVKRPKVFGLIYYRPDDEMLPTAYCRLCEANESQWAVESLSLNDSGILRCKTPAGALVHIPLAYIKYLDFSRGKVLYLSDIQPHKKTFTPYFGRSTSIPHWSELFTADRSVVRKTAHLNLAGRTYHKGLTLHSRTRVVYRLSEKYRWFRALAGIDDSVRPHGHVRLMILGDNRTLLDITLDGTEPPRSIDLDIQGVRQLGFFVDFGKELDIGDRLDLCNARVTK